MLSPPLYCAHSQRKLSIELWFVLNVQRILNEPKLLSDSWSSHVFQSNSLASHTQNPTTVWLRWIKSINPIIVQHNAERNTESEAPSSAEKNLVV